MDWLSSLGTAGEAIRFIILILEVLLVFNLMILVHEWGHFLAARWRGLKVEAFYIWFGKPIWKKTINGVEYGLGSIPAGGFVKLPQMAPMDAIEGESTSSEPLPPISPMDKIIVAFAGPLFSFGLACFFALLVSFFGKPQTESFVTTTIGYVAPDSPAQKAGLKTGDEIKAIDGNRIRRFEGFVDSVRWGIISSEGKTIKMDVERDGKPVPTIAVEAKVDDEEEKQLAWWQRIFARPALREIGIVGKQTPVVGAVQDNSPAAEAGFQPGDHLLKLDGQPLVHPAQVSDYIASKKDIPVTVSILRKGAGQDLTMVPRVPDKWESEEAPRPRVGIVFDLTGLRKIAHPGVYEQISDAARSMVSMIGKLLSPKSDIGPGHMSGPVGIGRVYYNLLQDSEAFLQVLWFSVVLNVNLAIMNLLPFPVLDGGHITMAIMEAIRRRPMQSRALEIFQTACALMLFGFIIFVTFKDTGDIFMGGSKKKTNPKDEIGWLPKEQRAAPPKAP